jgi:SAM-dependent methyltransferase
MPVARRVASGVMADLALPRSDEPFDFRHQAHLYARYRHNYSPALYAAIEARTGAGQGRCAADVGCGTGFVAAELARRGWHPVGVDFSAPMLDEARATAGSAVHLVRARGEALALRDESVALVTCGTSFHWLAPAPALAEMERVLAPGGWAALFWRYPILGEPSVHLVGEVLRRFGREVDAALRLVHTPDPFAGSGLVAEPGVVIATALRFSAEAFHGYVATVEWLRRIAGPDHAAFLDALRAELVRRHPDGFVEHCEEHLFLARRV